MIMPKPTNPNRRFTTILVKKETKTKMSRFRKSSTKRRGNESDDELLERILNEFSKLEPAGEPIGTYETVTKQGEVPK